MNAKKLIPLALIFAVVIIGLAMWKVDLFGRMFDRKVNSTEDLAELTKNITLELKAINEEDHALGNPTAPVQVIEYADTTCTHCADMQKILKEVLDKPIKEGKIVWVYRNFLSDAENNKEVRYLECIGKISGNENYWSYLDTLFTTPLSQKTESFFLSESKELNVSDKLLTECLKSDYTNKRIEKDMNDAIASGVIGTPYLFVIKKDDSIEQIVGLVPKVSVEVVINNALLGE